jgi:hypothetical protein
MSRMAADPMRTRHGFTCSLTADLGRMLQGACPYPVQYGRDDMAVPLGGTLYVTMAD